MAVCQCMHSDKSLARFGDISVCSGFMSCAKKKLWVPKGSFAAQKITVCNSNSPEVSIAKWDIFQCQ